MACRSVQRRPSWWQTTPMASDGPPHPPGLSRLAETETPVMAAGWVNHQQAVGNGGRPAPHHPVPGNMLTEGLSTADRPHEKIRRRNIPCVHWFQSWQVWSLRRWWSTCKNPVGWAWLENRQADADLAFQWRRRPKGSCRGPYSSLTWNQFFHHLQTLTASLA